MIEDLIEEIIAEFDGKLLVFNWKTQLYMMEGSMIAYIDEDEELKRTDNEVPVEILEAAFNDFYVEGVYDKPIYKDK